jgi:hypothetical protein
MKKRNLLTLGDEFLEYCKLNNVDDIEKMAKDTFQRGFTILKYGEIPSQGTPKEIIKIQEVEKIVEVIKEVPIEIKGETQIITKEIPITDEETIKKLELLQTENDKLKDELEKITKSLEKLNKGSYLKSSDLSNLYDE